MSRRFILPAGALAAAALALAPAGAMAANKSVTINATPNPDVTGEPVTIYGQLTAPHNAGRRVVLWHRIAGQRHFTIISRTRTTATGFYDFQRAEGVVRTNRNWFVRSAGVRSPIVHEKVHSEIKMVDPPPTVLTRQRVAFVGTVTPGNVHRGDRVYLQVQRGANGDKWHTIDRGRVRAGGAFAIYHRFALPGSRTLRVLIKRDRFNLAAATTPVSLSVEQGQNAKFTLNASTNPIVEGGSVTLSGDIDGKGHGGRTVTLLAKDATHGFRPVASTTSDAAGHYAFTQTPLYSTVYRARIRPGRHSRVLYEGVRDAVSIGANATSVAQRETVTFSGSVAPAKPGHVVLLQRLGDDGAFHTVAEGRINAGSRYALNHTFGSTGTKTFRVVVPGDPRNLRGVSDTLNITVH